MVATGLLLTGGAPLEAQPQPAPSKAEEEVKAQIDGARGLAVSPDSAAVYVTGISGGQSFDYVTIAYSTR